LLLLLGSLVFEKIRKQVENGTVRLLDGLLFAVVRYFLVLLLVQDGQSVVHLDADLTGLKDEREGVG
jgi:hypothetical protein